LTASILYQPNGNVELSLFLRHSYLSLILSMVIYQLTNVDDKFIMIKSFSWIFLFYSLLTDSIESKLIVNLSMIIYHIIKLMMNLSQLSHLDLVSMLSGHRIKSYCLIECDKSYPLTDINDKFIIVIFHVIKSLWEIRN
jgi:hypothetical protein